MDPTPVHKLVEAARQGDQTAWNSLVDRFLPLVNAIIANHRLARADAEDVNQTVWLRLVEHLDSIREPRALPGWIATTTKRECFRTLRAIGRVRPIDPQTSSPLESIIDPKLVDTGVLDAEQRHALREALLELPDDRRELLMMLAGDPPTPYAEISDRLGIAIGSIGPTRKRALQQLRNTHALQAYLGDDLPVEQRS